MGRVVVCHGAFGALRGEVRAMLESDVIQLRGDVHANVRLAGLECLRAEGDCMLAISNGELLALELGQKEAQLWVHKIQNPTTLPDKLGLAAGLSVYVHEQHEEIMRVLAPAGVQLVSLVDAALVFLMVDTPTRLMALQSLAHARPAGAQFWILRVKGKGASVREADIMAAAKAVGLSPSKTSAWSDSYSADRYGARRTA